MLWPGAPYIQRLPRVCCNRFPATRHCCSYCVSPGALGGALVFPLVSTNPFVLTNGNTNAPPNAPGLTQYEQQCLVAGNLLQQTRGSRWMYGAPGHSMYNHHRGPNDSQPDCR